MGSHSKKQPTESTLHEEKVAHIFKHTDHSLHADTAHHGSLSGRERKPETKKTQEISFWGFQGHSEFYLLQNRNWDQEGHK
jgi:hypothetical protein